MRRDSRRWMPSLDALVLAAKQLELGAGDVTQALRKKWEEAMQQPYVVARELSKAFDGKRVLDDVSFAVEPGDVIGVLGKNGAGKTTLLELVLGFTPASGGHVEVFGHESYRLPGSCQGARRLRAAAGRAHRTAVGRGSAQARALVLLDLGRRARSSASSRRGAST